METMEIKEGDDGFVRVRRENLERQRKTEARLRREIQNLTDMVMTYQKHLLDTSARFSNRCSQIDHLAKENRELKRKVFKMSAKAEIDRHGIIVHDETAIPYVTAGSGGDVRKVMQMLSDWVMTDPMSRVPRGIGHDAGRLVVVSGGHPSRCRLAYRFCESQMLFLVADEYREVIDSFAAWCNE